MTVNRRRWFWVFFALTAVFLAATLAILLRQCGQFSSTASDYIPSKINGKAVDRGGPVAREVATSLKGKNVTSVFGASVGGGGEGANALPDLMLVSATLAPNSELGCGALRSDVAKTAGKAQDITLEGADVQLLDISGGGGTTGGGTTGGGTTGGGTTGGGAGGGGATGGGTTGGGTTGGGAGTGISFAFAEPQRHLCLIAAAFHGGQDNAKAAMAAMLTSGRK